MENKKVKGPKMVPSRWKITPLQPSPTGEGMMMIEDTEKKVPTVAISHGDAMRKYKITSHIEKVGGLDIPMPDSKYSEADIDLSNQVHAYIASVNTPDAKKEVKRGRPATGRKNYDHAAYQKAYRERLKQKKIKAAQEAKQGI